MAGAGRIGAPIAELSLTQSDLQAADTIVQLGLPPGRIDLLTHLSGLADFSRAWNNRTEPTMHGRRLPVIGKQDLIANKLATRRLKDLADLEALGIRVDR